MEFVDPPSDQSWDGFCTAAEAAWFWHGTRWRDYTIAYRPELESRSMAFMVRDAGATLAAVPLMLERHREPDRLEFSFGGSACWSPALAPGLGPRHALHVLEAALVHVDSLARSLGVVRVRWRLSPLGHGFLPQLAHLLSATTRLGYVDVSGISQVIDVSQSAVARRADATKGHRADIGRAQRQLEVDALIGQDVSPSDFAGYVAMHALAAGRVTRPRRTFDLMERWLHEERALLARARHGGAEVGYAYVLLHADGAYYASAANLPEATLPIGHAIQGAVGEWLHDHGYHDYELGAQPRRPLLHEVPTAKDVAIARFKRGFGGVTVPLIEREKFYSRPFLVSVLQGRVSSFADASPDPASESP